MYGYEYGGYNYGCGCGVPAYPRRGGSTFALIVVLFILLVIIGAAYVR